MRKFYILTFRRKGEPPFLWKGSFTRVKIPVRATDKPMDEGACEKGGVPYPETLWRRAS